MSARRRRESGGPCRDRSWTGIRALVGRPVFRTRGSTLRSCAGAPISSSTRGGRRPVQSTLTQNSSFEPPRPRASSGGRPRTLGSLTRSRARPSSGCGFLQGESRRSRAPPHHWQPPPARLAGPAPGVRASVPGDPLQAIDSDLN
jgi:hypothetical protein